MLVISRKVQQTICIGNDVKVRVLECRRGRVRLGIVAPPDVRIWCAEKLERQQEVQLPRSA